MTELSPFETHRIEQKARRREIALAKFSISMTFLVIIGILLRNNGQSGAGSPMLALGLMGTMSEGIMYTLPKRTPLGVFCGLLLAPNVIPLLLKAFFAIGNETTLFIPVVTLITLKILIPIDLIRKKKIFT